MTTITIDNEQFDAAKPPAKTPHINLLSPNVDINMLSRTDYGTVAECQFIFYYNDGNTAGGVKFEREGYNRVARYGRVDEDWIALVTTGDTFDNATPYEAPDATLSTALRLFRAHVESGGDVILAIADETGKAA